LYPVGIANGVVCRLANSTHGLALLRTLSSRMPPIKAEETPVGGLQFLNRLPCVRYYLLAVLGPMSSRFTEGSQRSLHRSFWFAWPRACLEGGGGGYVGRSWRRLDPYFLGVEGSVHLLVKVFQQFCDAALRISFTLRLDKPTAAVVGWKSTQEFLALRLANRHLCYPLVL
jgi:hypothetical protein